MLKPDEGVDANGDAPHISADRTEADALCALCEPAPLASPLCVPKTQTRT
jgi:hypothetical protein